jgi:hypothetical protein
MHLKWNVFWDGTLENLLVISREVFAKGLQNGVLAKSPDRVPAGGRHPATIDGNRTLKQQSISR